MRTLKDILTPREYQIAGLIAEAYTNREIAARLGLKHQYLKHRVTMIYEKIGFGRIQKGRDLTPRIELVRRFVTELHASPPYLTVSSSPGLLTVKP